MKPIDADTEEIEIGVTISGNSVIRLEHITVTGGFARGISVEGKQARLTLGKGAVVSGNGGKADLDLHIQIGGGILASNGATLIMRDNAVVSGNYAGTGGGVCILESHLKMYDNAVIRGNVARDDSFELGGGGIFGQRGSIELRDNSMVTGNSGVYAGGICLIAMSGIQTGDGPVGEGSGVYESRYVFGNTATESSFDWEVGHNIYIMNY